MYNTVGETAGVTQDVGSDPTVCGFDFDIFDVDIFGCCCVFCGMELGEEEEEEEEEEEQEGEGKEGDVDVKVFDLSEMIGVENADEDEDEEMGGEPDTTGNADDKTHH